MIVDELGYLSFDEGGAELLFYLLSNFNDRVLFYEHKPYLYRWQERVKDSTLAGTLVDMRGANYWIKQTSECMNQLNNE